MSETIDPITWLRDQISSNKSIALNAKSSELEIENNSAAMRIPKDSQTAWKRKDGKGYYTVGSLWLMLKMKDSKVSDYSREAAKLGIPLVDFRDKKDATDYFTTGISESAQIDTAKRAQTLIRKSQGKSGTAAGAQG